MMWEEPTGTMNRPEANKALGVEPLTDEELLGLFAGIVSEDVLERLLLAPSAGSPAEPAPRGALAEPALPPSPEARARVAALRLARVIVDDIRLYNEEALAEGRRRRDLYTRLKDAIDRALALWRERVPPDIPEAATALRDAMVEGLALGDDTAFGPDLVFPFASPDPQPLLRLDVSDDGLPPADLAEDERETLLRAREASLVAPAERVCLGPRFDRELQRYLDRVDSDILSIEDARYDLAVSLSRLGYFDEAIAQLDQGIEPHGERAALLGELLLARGLPRAASRWLEIALADLQRSWRRRAAATYALAQAREAELDLEQSLTLYQKALQLDPSLASQADSAARPWYESRVTGELFGWVLYCGPRSSGKTASLRHIADRTHPRRGHRSASLLTFDREDRRTLLFDFLPLDLGSAAGRRVCVHLVTLPGEEVGRAVRQRLLAEALGVVFVADSRQDALADNRRTLDALLSDLTVAGVGLERFPLVLQYNRRDGARALPVTTLDLVLNEGHWPTVESVALRGPGVHTAARTLLKAALARWPLT